MKCRREIEKPCIDVQTEVCETEEVCKLNEDTVACHEITVLWHKECTVYTDILVESIDDGVKYVDSGAPKNSATHVLLSPARPGDPGSKTIQFGITKMPDTEEQADRLRVTVLFYLPGSDSKEKKNATVPDAYPEVKLI